MLKCVKVILMGFRFPPVFLSSFLQNSKAKSGGKKFPPLGHHRKNAQAPERIRNAAAIIARTCDVPPILARKLVF